MRLRHLVFSSLFTLATLSGGAFPATITIEEGRRIAQAALSAGQPETTLKIARSLLQANPKDNHALLLAAAANLALKKPLHGRRAAALAYRNSEHTPQRLQAAQLAAQNALLEERPTLTQIWLRRAALHVETEEQSQAIARAYKRLRVINPWSFNAGLSIRPSSNINNGSDSALQIIDGVPAVGTLSGDAQALPGLIGTANLRLGYRLHANEKRRTTLGFQTQIRRVALASEAKALAPDTSSRAFAYTYAATSLEHVFAVGEKKGEFVSLGATAGGLWTPDDISYSLLRFEGERVWRTKAGNGLRLGASYTGYNRDGDVNDSTSFGLRGGYTHKLESGDRLGFTLAYDKNSSDAANLRSDSFNMRVSYTFAKAWGPATASASLSLSHADYPDYSVGFIDVPGGRQDTSAYADLSLFFKDLDYAGFAPRVTLRAGKTSSNVSRFETKELSIQVGIQSKF